MADSWTAPGQFSLARRAVQTTASLYAQLLIVVRDGQGAILPVLGLSAIILFLRKPYALLTPQLWAEDGKVLFLQQWEQGCQALFVPYAGYLCVGQRAIAWLADELVSLPYLPLFYSLAAMFCSLFAGWFVLRCRLDVPYKPLMALALLMVPIGPEVFMNAINVQWVLGPLLVILAMQENPQTPRAACFDLCVLILLGLSGPLAVVLSPLLLLRPLLFGSNRYNQLFFVVALALTTVQGWLILTSGRVGGPLVSRNWGGILRVTIRNFVPQLLLGQETRTASGLVLLIASGAALIHVWRGSAAQVRRPQSMLLLALAFVLGTTILFGPAPHGYDAFGCGQRYFYVPYVLIAWFYLLGLSSPQKRVREIAVVTSVMIMISAATHLVSPPLPNLDWRGHVQPLAEGRTATIPLNPEIVGAIVVQPRPTTHRR